MEGNIGISGVISSRVGNNKPVQIISILTYNKENKAVGYFLVFLIFRLLKRLRFQD